jgi:hypothetical protein
MASVRNHSKSHNGKNKDTSNVGKRHFIASNTSSGSALRVRVADDVTRKSLSPLLDRLLMPKNFQTQIHWFQTTYVQNTSLANNAITEVNLTFSLNQTAISAAIVALYDQYAIFAAYVRVNVNTSGPSPTSAPMYATALDYDNVTALGSLPVLQGYSTSAVTNISDTQERYIEPCNAPALWGGGAFNNYGQARMWVDCANNQTPHYGFRSIIAALGAGVTGNITYEVTLVICARNVV